jgi:hypothetical protein
MGHSVAEKAAAKTDWFDDDRVFFKTVFFMING